MKYKNPGLVCQGNLAPPRIFGVDVAVGVVMYKMNVMLCAYSDLEPPCRQGGMKQNKFSGERFYIDVS